MYGKICVLFGRRKYNVFLRLEEMRVCECSFLDNQNYRFAYFLRESGNILKNRRLQMTEKNCLTKAGGRMYKY